MKILVILIALSLAACGVRHAPRGSVVPPQQLVERDAAPPPPPAPVKPPVTANTNAPEPVAPPPPEAPPPSPDLATVIRETNGLLRDALFDYDQAALRPDAMEAIRANTALLQPLLSRFPGLEVVIEGHCDERGSSEYNLGLGDGRARRAADYAAQLGLTNVRIVSYGKEKPQCSDANEACWQRNRRAHFQIVRQPT